jgi:hypothetical protein
VVVAMGKAIVTISNSQRFRSLGTNFCVSTTYTPKSILTYTPNSILLRRFYWMVLFKVSVLLCTVLRADTFTGLSFAWSLETQGLCLIFTHL